MNCVKRKNTMSLLVLLLVSVSASFYVSLCRIDDLEEAVKMNERLHQQVKQKEERITSLQERWANIFRVL